MVRRLIDDCFLHDKERLRHDEALAILKARLAPVVEPQTVPLVDGLGNILSQSITAPQSVPLTDNSAVDGYAFAIDDMAACDGAFPISVRIAAGAPADQPLAPGSAARIFTGAVMPEGADTVVMQEDCETSEADGQPMVTIPKGLKRGANWRKAGEDILAGTEILRPGTRLRPQDIASIASTGAQQVAIYRPLRVALASSGDEIVRGGKPLTPGQVYDSNNPLLTTLLAGLPVEITDLGVLPDDEALVIKRLAEAAERFDLILTTGGASRGEEDHLITAIDTLGTRHLWQLAIKPGRPMSFGQIGDCVLMSLPGNPVAVFVCFLLYARPSILALAGGTWETPTGFMLPASFEIGRKKPDRREFLRGILARDGSTAVGADKFSRDGSGLISGLRAADGLIELPEEVEHVAKGDLVRFLPFSEFGIG